MKKTVLAIKMLERADKDNLPADHNIRLTATKFEDAAAHKRTTQLINLLNATRKP